MRTDNIDHYNRHIVKADEALARVGKAINTYALLRLGTIVGGGTALFAAVQAEQLWAVLVMFFAALLLFFWLVWRQSRLEQQKTELLGWRTVNQNELDVAAGRPNQYSDGAAFKAKSHPYSDDLDVFGPYSLFARINRCATVEGNRLLAGWLSAPADSGVIKKRQQAVSELAGESDWCQQFQVNLLFNLREHSDFKTQFARYLKQESPAFGNRLFRLYVKAAPLLMVLMVGLAVFIPVFRTVAVFLAFAHLLWTTGYAAKVNRVAGKMSRAGRLLAAFAGAIRLIEQRDWQSPLSKKLSGTLLSENGRASAALDALATILDRLDYRLNMLVGAVLNMVALWDFRQVFAIVDWRRQYGTAILSTFDVVHEFEALMSLATLSRNHPQWHFPVVVDSPTPVIEATRLAHPLIPADGAVANDYRMESHRIALITGSNMAGKSTFLRTVGSNAVLAFCGAPVCAGQLRISVFRLVTYMRIADALNESTSTFKAELNRIQLVLQTVKEEPDTFFLIDEMLRGTNSFDKYRGSKAIIERLIADGGVGMVATHDLQLAKLADEHSGVVENYHFDIEVSDGDMLFDYKLKAGECTIFNASLLLRSIGITVK